jgi:hypothetical protein
VYCNANGQPDPNGSYEKRDGKLILRDGRSAQFFMDSQSSVTLTDAERGYAIARARAEHDMCHGHLPIGDRPAFSAKMEAAAVDAATARKSVSSTTALGAVEASRLQSEAAGARAARKYVTSNAWRN